MRFASPQRRNLFLSRFSHDFDRGVPTSFSAAALAMFFGYAATLSRIYGAIDRLMMLRWRATPSHLIDISLRAYGTSHRRHGRLLIMPFHYYYSRISRRLLMIASALALLAATFRIMKEYQDFAFTCLCLHWRAAK